jgi:hypothetical protein
MVFDADGPLEAGLPAVTHALNPKEIMMMELSTYCKEVIRFPDMAASAQLTGNVIGTMYQ